MHRDLAFHHSKLAAPIELQGRSVKQSPQKNPGSNGKWENLIGGPHREVTSPRSVANRAIESANAHRIMHPELATDDVYHKTRKIAQKDSSPEVGNMMHLFKKTGTVEDVYSTRKKYFKEMQQTEAQLPPKVEKRYVKPNERKLDDWCSHIPTLHSPTYVEKNFEHEESGLRSPASPTRKLKQDFLKSSIATLSNGEDTRKNFVDRDEAKIRQSMYSPRTAKHMASSFLDEPLHVTSNKKDPNRMNYSSYEEGNRLNPWTKGKKVAYPQYTEKNASTHVPDNGGVYSPKSGGFEPIDPMFIGRRSIATQPIVNNIVSPPKEKNVPRGQTAYSYRTYASQVF